MEIMNQIKFALKLANDCTYADAMTEGAKQHLRAQLSLALEQWENPISQEEIYSKIDIGVLRATVSDAEFRRKLSEMCEKGQVKKPFTIHYTTTITLNFTDKLSVLFGRKIRTESEIKVDREIAVLGSTATAIVTPLFPKKKTLQYSYEITKQNDNEKQEKPSVKG